MSNQNSVDPAQLEAELRAAFTTMMLTQAMTACVAYQQWATALALPESWSADRLLELAATIDVYAEKTPRAHLARGYAEQLRIFAKNLIHPPTSGPRLTLLDGGLGPADEPESA